MTEVRTSRPEEVARQKELWKRSFGDSDSYIDFYYEHYYRPERVYVLAEDDTVHAMLTLFPSTLYLPDGTTVSAPYIYALCTDPDQRGNGLARRLIYEVGRQQRALGASCLTLVPQEASLFRYFQSLGFERVFSQRQVELAQSRLAPLPADGSVDIIGVEEYNRIRERLLAGSCHVAYDDEVIAYQKGVAKWAGGDLYRVLVDGVEGVAEAERMDDHHAIMKELIIPEEQRQRAITLVASMLPADRYLVRLPSFLGDIAGSYAQAFGVALWLDEELAQRWDNETNGYLGLAFD